MTSLKSRAFRQLTAAAAENLCPGRVAIVAAQLFVVAGLAATPVLSQFADDLPEVTFCIQFEEYASRQSDTYRHLRKETYDAGNRADQALERFRTMKARVEGAQCDYEGGVTNKAACDVMQSDYRQALLDYRAAQERFEGFTKDIEITSARVEEYTLKAKECRKVLAEAAAAKNEHKTLQTGSFVPGVNLTPDEIYESGGLIINLGSGPWPTPNPAPTAPPKAPTTAAPGTPCVTKDGKTVAAAPVVAKRGNMAPAEPAAKNPCPPGSEPKKRDGAATASLDQVAPVAPHVVPMPASVPVTAVHTPPLPPSSLAPSSVHTPPHPPAQAPKAAAPGANYQPPQPPALTGPALVYAPPVYVSPTHVKKPGAHTGKPTKKHPPKGVASSKPSPQVNVHPNKPKFTSPGGRPAPHKKKPLR